MKKTLVLLTLAAAVSAYSQGTVNFTTRDTGNGVNAVVTYGTGGPVTAAAKPSPLVSIADSGFTWGGINAKAGLYGGANNTAPGNLVLLVPSVGFRTGAAAGYIDPGSVTERTVSGVPGGALASFQLRAWDAGVAGIDTYEAAVALSSTRKVYFGVSAPLNGITLGNFTPPGGTPTLPAALAGLGNVTMDYIGVPEPSVIGLGILGALAGLMVFRRRN